MKVKNRTGDYDRTSSVECHNFWSVHFDLLHEDLRTRCYLVSSKGDRKIV